MPRRHPQTHSKLILDWAARRADVVSIKTHPPDPANLKFVWTCSAMMRTPQSGDGHAHKVTGFGAGISSVEAIAKAISEALERYAASCCSENELRYSTIADQGDDYLDPRHLCLYSTSQYARADFPYTRFRARNRIAWTRGRWLDTGTQVWLPAFMTYFGADVSIDQSFAQITTSGLATGASLEDATIRAVSELIERDAFMITWLAQKPATRLVADSTLDSHVQRLVAAFAERGVEPRFYLLDAGLGIPVVLCLVRGDGRNWPGATVGLGADANPAIAMRKAMLEQALMGPALRKEMLTGRRVPARARDIKTTLDHALYYVPEHRARAFNFLDEQGDTVRLSEVPRSKNISLRLYAKLLQGVGVRAAIKDLTPRDIAAETPFRVVRALATQLQPIHFGHGLTREGNSRLRNFAKDGLNVRPHPLA